MKKKISFLRKAASELGAWQKTIITKHRKDDEDEAFPHPAAAPVGTDQEAGGASTTPSGIRLYGDGDGQTVRKP